MNYIKARQHIEKLTNEKGMVFGLESIKALLESLGIEFKIPVIHVAGTNGKGSLCGFVTEILIKAGYNVGTYTTPAVGTPMEIIRYNGMNMDAELYASYISKIEATAEVNKLTPTAFEVETAVAFMYFEECSCDICVIEAGLGGMYDATNIISSTLVAAITSVGMDHMSILGEKIEEIAYNKAGIIKPGTTVVVQDNPQSVLQVIREKAKASGAEVVITNRPADVYYGVKTRFKYAGIKRDVIIRQPGAYQVENACQAIEIALELRRHGYKIEEEHILMGLENMHLPFRYETIHNEPRIIIDGAHNEDAVSELVKNIKSEFKDTKITMVIGMFKDKDYSKVIDMTYRYAHKYIVLTPPGKRGLQSSELCKCIREITKNTIEVIDCDEISSAATYVLQNATKDDIILAFGSLSYLNTFKETILLER